MPDRTLAERLDAARRDLPPGWHIECPAPDLFAAASGFYVHTWRDSPEEALTDARRLSNGQP